MKHKNGKYVDRRHFLQMLSTAGMAASLHPLQMFLSSVANASVMNRFALDSGINPRKLIFIQFAGAPSRWIWDLFLNPNATDNYRANPYVATRFRDSGSGRNDTLEYATMTHPSTQLGANINIPVLWGYQVPKAGGGTRPMSDLLNYMLQIRGIDILDFGHAGAQSKMMALDSSIASLGGLVADYSSTPIPSVGIDVQELNFKSRLGSSLIRLEAFNSGPNLLQTLFGSFKDQAGTTHKAKLDSVDTLINQSLDPLDEQMKEYSESLANDRKNAFDLLKTGVGDLDSEWNTLWTKYNTLRMRAISEFAMVGINDKVVGNGTNHAGDEKWRLNTAGQILTETDLRNIIQPGMDPAIHTVNLLLAEHFAVAEFALTKGYCNSIHLSMAMLFNLTASINGAARALGVHTFDQHFCGAFPNTFLAPYIYVSFAACLLELIDQLKAKGMFDETLIYCGGEFGRSPQGTGFGSDHGSDAHSMSCFSGFINNGPHIIGNIVDQHPNSTFRSLYPGTWGTGAPVVGNNTVQANGGHLLASVAQLLRVPNPAPNTDPILSVTDNSIVSLIGNPKTVSIP